MKIVNETRYETAALRELTRRVAAEELDPAKRRRMVVRFHESVRGITKDRWLGYCASLGGDRISIVLPANPAKADVEKTAHVLAHEFAHARGMRHSDMRNNPRYAWVYRDALTWREMVRQRGFAVGLVLRHRPADKREPVEDDAKLEHAVERMRVWERKRRRAETGIKVWRRRVQYYERKIAAKAPPAGGAE